MDCEHLLNVNNNDTCSLSSNLVNERVRVTPGACETCLKGPNPKSINKVTVSLALYQIKDRDPERYAHMVSQYKHHLAPPTTVEKVKSYAESTAEWMLDGFATRTDEEVAEIFKICEDCDPHYIKYSEMSGTCNLCGCNVNLYNGFTNKIKRANEHCPLGKW